VSGPLDGAAAVAPSTISWTCFTSSVFAPSGCPARRLTLQTVATGASAPAAPTGLTGGVQGSAVTLNWQAPPGETVTSYLIEAGTAAGLSNITDNFDTGGSRTSITVNNVPNGTYFIRLRARTSSGLSLPSNEITLIVGGSGPGPGPGPCTGAPDAATNLTASAFGSTVLLNWERSQNTGCFPTSYLIEAGSTPGSSNLAQVNTGNTNRSFSASGVAAGTYYVRVRALNGSTAGAASNEVTVTVTGTSAPSTTWVGLVANGDGVTSTMDDPDCGIERQDLTFVFSQSGTSFTGTGTVTTRVSRCEAIGRSDTQPIAGTISGSLSSGSGTITGTIGTGTRALTFNGSFTSTRMTGTLTQGGMVGGTFAINKQ
jgi:hypothetical protein